MFFFPNEFLIFIFFYFSLFLIIPIFFFPHRIPNAHREALVESLTANDDACGLVRLHPEVFGRFPLLHLVRRSLEWQENMRSINYVHEQTKAELPGSDKKPWQQKGLGRARQGSWRSPQFVKGGKVGFFFYFSLGCSRSESLIRDHIQAQAL